MGVGLTTGGRCETTLDVMDVITQTSPETSTGVVEVAGLSAGRKYATELIRTLLFLFTVAAAVLSSSSFALAGHRLGALVVVVYAGDTSPVATTTPP